MASTVLVTGASRGIGLQLVSAYAQRGWRVLACARSAAPALEDVARTHSTVKVLPLDVACPDSIDRLQRALGPQPIDVLIHNAGVYTDKRKALGDVTFADWTTTMAVNVAAPFMLTQALLPNVLAGAHKKVVFMTSGMGSIGNNTTGGSYVYRASKAALNAAGVSLAKDLESRGVAVVMLHPGWVKTDMGGWEEALITAEESVRGMLAVVDSLALPRTGRFVNYRGEELPW